MANEKRLDLIDRSSLGIGKAKREVFDNPTYADGWNSAIAIIENAPTVDAVEVVHGYKPGDVCFYGFAGENKSLALVEIVKVGNDERGIAEIRFLKVFVDDTGNGMFDYLLRTGQTMNASFKYLKNITPIYEEVNK